MKFTEEKKEIVREIIADKLGCDIEEVIDQAEIKDHLGADSLD